MNEAVADHHYYLQALIYAIAVARCLQTARQTVTQTRHPIPLPARIGAARTTASGNGTRIPNP